MEMGPESSSEVAPAASTGPGVRPGCRRVPVDAGRAARRRGARAGIGSVAELRHLGLALVRHELLHVRVRLAGGLLDRDRVAGARTAAPPSPRRTSRRWARPGTGRPAARPRRPAPRRRGRSPRRDRWPSPAAAGVLSGPGVANGLGREDLLGRQRGLAGQRVVVLPRAGAEHVVGQVPGVTGPRAERGLVRLGPAAERFGLAHGFRLGVGDEIPGRARGLGLGSDTVTTSSALGGRRRLLPGDRLVRTGRRTRRGRPGRPQRPARRRRRRVRRGRPSHRRRRRRASLRRTVALRALLGPVDVLDRREELVEVLEQVLAAALGALVVSHCWIRPPGVPSPCDRGSLPPRRRTGR